MKNLNPQLGCFPKIHAKIFEILLIICFLLSIIILVVNLIITIWHFKFSLYFFIIEIGLIAFNGINVIFSIILRVWRSNGSVLSNNFSSSNCICLLVIILILINFLSTIAEDVFFYLVYSFLDILNKRINNEKVDKEKMKKKEKIYSKIMNKISDDKSPDWGDDPNKKLKLLKLLPWIGINFNLFVQIISFIFIVVIKQRIRFKSDLDIPPNLIDLSSSQNQIGTNKNSNAIVNDNIYNRNKNKKKSTKSKNNNNGMISEPESDKKNIKAKKRKKTKNSRKKKN